jgi:hypothetical protein
MEPILAISMLVVAASSSLANEKSASLPHLLANGADGISDIEGKAARKAASEWSRGAARDIDGKTETSDGAFRRSDIEGKVARVAARKRGRVRVSNGREPMSQCRQRASFNSFYRSALPVSSF